MLDRIRALYEGTGETAQQFRYALLAFDIGTILFVVFTSFTSHDRWVGVVDVVLGLVTLADFACRVAIETRRLRFFLAPTTWADIAAIASFLMPLTGEGVAFLRVMRTLRLLRTYHLLNSLREDVPYFRRNEEVIVAAINLCVFIFVMTGVVYACQHLTNPDIANYYDALYFTVTALTTTGFGDITLQGEWGRLISITVMIFGVTLFLRLAQVLFRPTKVRSPCSDCGLLLHEPDAVDCKHCGALVRIETEGG